MPKQPVRVSLTATVLVSSPSEAAKLFEPLLANMPQVEQFNLSVKGDYFFANKPVRARKTSRVERDIDRQYA